jgi:DNA polymerase III subunit delta
MRLNAADLEAHLKRQLLPIYLLTGDEPLQLGEAADRLRRHARDQGYASREVFEADARFDWGGFLHAANSLSLFAERRILDLRIPGTPGQEGGKALTAYAERPAEDSLLLITLPKLDKAQQASKWFKALEQAGAVLQVWPVEPAQLPAWIERRMRAKGLQPSREAVLLLADRVEGNLLAAAQEIDKLALLHPVGALSAEELEQAVADSARYDVFKLVDAALEGKTARVLRILHGLQGEGAAEPIVLWALVREIRTLAAIAADLERGVPPQRALDRPGLWEKRKPLLGQGARRLSLRRWRRLLQLCARADRAIKGRDAADPWLLFQDIATQMAGAPAIAGLRS